MNAVARTQLIFEMLALFYIYIYISFSAGIPIKESDRVARQILEQLENHKPETRSFGSSRDSRIWRSITNGNEVRFSFSIQCVSYFTQTTWWRHQMETFSALLALCAGNSPMTGEFPTQRSSNAELWCFFGIGEGKQVNEPSICWWFETLLRPLWRHCNASISQQGILKHHLKSVIDIQEIKYRSIAGYVN